MSIKECNKKLNGLKREVYLSEGYGHPEDVAKITLTDISDMMAIPIHDMEGSSSVTKETAKATGHFGAKELGHDGEVRKTGFKINVKVDEETINVSVRDINGKLRQNFSGQRDKNDYNVLIKSVVDYASLLGASHKTS